MSQEVHLQGATYTDVPSVLLPDSNGVTHSFVDTSDATATASDIAAGMTAYVAGSLVTGTASGATVATATATSSSTSTTSLSFSVDAEPVAFALIATGNISLSSGYYQVSSIVWDGSTYHSNVGYYKSGGGGSRYVYHNTGYASSSYSNGTLTVSTGSSRSAVGGAYYNTTYTLVYIY